MESRKVEVVLVAVSREVTAVNRSVAVESYTSLGRA